MHSTILLGTIVLYARYRVVVDLIGGIWRLRDSGSRPSRDQLMARYFYNLHELDGVIEDEEGSEAANDEAANTCAIRAARDVMGGCVQDGELCMGWHIEIQNAVHEAVATVQFKDAVAITGM